MKIRIVQPGHKKIALIKAVRYVTGFNLKDAKALVDKSPVTFEVNVEGDHVQRVIEEFRDTGASMEFEVDPPPLDKLTAASYISTASVALGQGNVKDARNSLRAALRLLGDIGDIDGNNIVFVGAGQL